MTQHLANVIQSLSLAKTLDEVIRIVRGADRVALKANEASFILTEHFLEKLANKHQGTPNVYEDNRVLVAVHRLTFLQRMAIWLVRMVAPLGAIGIYWEPTEPLDEDEARLSQSLVEATALAIENTQSHNKVESIVKERTLELQIENKQLQQKVVECEETEAQVRLLSMTDDLTGLNNRRGFLFLAEHQLKLARRSQFKTCLLFVDLDGLKRVNDCLGHKMGDRLIVDAADVLKTTFRESDILARLGGDEFAVFISGCSREDSIADRLESSLSCFNLTQGRSYSVQMSIGIATCKTGVMPLDQMIARADQLMYLQKQAKKQEIPTW